MLLLHDADDYSAPDSWRRTAAALPRVLETLAERGLAAGRALTPLSRRITSTACRPPYRSTRAASAATVSSAGALPQARSRLRTRWWVEALTIGWLCWVYDAITNLAPLRLHAALAHGSDILSLERSLHIDPEHALDRWLAGHHTLGVLLSYYYDNAHFIVTLGLLGFLWWRRADIYRAAAQRARARQRARVRRLLAVPRGPAAHAARVRGRRRRDVTRSARGTPARWPSAANQFAAMPSLHIAWAVWCTIALWQITARRWVRALAVIYPCVTAFAVLATGNHYVLDMLGGLVTIAVSVLIVRLLGGRLRLPDVRALRGRRALARADRVI